MTEISTKADIRKLSLEKLKEVFVQHGEQAFRAKQLYEWLWKKSATSFEEMTNLSVKTRAFLEDFKYCSKNHCS